MTDVEPFFFFPIISNLLNSPHTFIECAAAMTNTFARTHIGMNIYMQTMCPNKKKKKTATHKHR